MVKLRLQFLTLCCLAAFQTSAFAEEQVDTQDETQEQVDQEASDAENTNAETDETQAESTEMEGKGESSVDLEVKGIEEKDKDAWANVKVYLSQLKEIDSSERYQAMIQETVDKALRAEGYYNTQYQFVIEPRADKKPLMVLNVDMDSEQVKVDETDIQISGEAKQDEDFEKLVETAPKKDTVLGHKTYDSFKSNLETLAFKKGYFDGSWLYHRLEVYPREHVADWRLGYDSGVRYHYGQINFVDSQIRDDYMRNILRIKPGDPYYANDLSTLTSDYSSSNWFSSVLVEPKQNEKEKTVDLNVLLQPRKRNEIEVGLGFATDVGPFLQFNWKKPWINSRGHSIESKTYISAPEQTFEFGYNIPLKSDPLHYYYQFSGTLENEDQNDTKSTAAAVGFQRFWTNETGWSFSAGVKARYDAFTQGPDKFTTLLLYPTASLNRTRSDGKRFPSWGDTQKLTVNWGSKAWGSDVNFYSAKLSTAWIRTYFTNHRIYLRGEVGYIKSNEFERIPPALRYFAGGDMSVRGFGYKDISPKDPVTGKYVGGSHLATATAEYQYQVMPDWWGAIFYDTGLASNKFKGKDLHSGVGVGVRWASPIGAIKFDIATPVKSPNNDSGVQFYIGLGSEL